MENCASIFENLRKLHCYQFWILKNFSWENLEKRTHSQMNIEMKNVEKLVRTTCQKSRKLDYIFFEIFWLNYNNCKYLESY